MKTLTIWKVLYNNYFSHLFISFPEEQIIWPSTENT